MRSTRSSLSALAAMAMMHMGAAVAGAAETIKIKAASAADAYRPGARMGAYTGVWNYPRPGQSVRQGQRAARKARQVARNRRHHRRAGR